MWVYLWPAAILVRRGNQENIRKVADLDSKNVKIPITHGTGQVGMWKNIAGRQGDIGTIKVIRKNIDFFASHIGVAGPGWLKDDGFDAWLVFSIRRISNPDDDEIVLVEPEYCICRLMDIALAQDGQKNRCAAGFFTGSLLRMKGRGFSEIWLDGERITTDVMIAGYVTASRVLRDLNNIRAEWLFT